MRISGTAAHYAVHYGGVAPALGYMRRSSLVIRPRGGGAAALPRFIFFSLIKSFWRGPGEQWGSTDMTPRGSPSATLLRPELSDSAVARVSWLLQLTGIVHAFQPHKGACTLVEDAPDPYR